MRLARIGTTVAIMFGTLLAGAAAMADPPSTNPNVVVFSVGCSRGLESESFQAVSILQNQAIALQRLDGHGVFVYTHIELDGQVFFDVPGQAGRSDLWTCTIAQYPGAVFEGRLTSQR
jgi:hypothetical protein